MRVVVTCWQEMNALDRRAVPNVTRACIPLDPGVYALYRDGKAMYVGKAGDLQYRIWKCHLAKGVSMTNSALRRNVAELLGIASATEIKAGRYKPTLEDARRVSEWIRASEFAWVQCDSMRAAKDLEDALKREWKPPLTKL